MSERILDEVCRLFGNQDAMAAALGIRSASISGWRKRSKGRIPVAPRNRVLQVEALLKGQMTRHDMRPDIYGPAPRAADEPAPRKRAAC